MSDDQQKEPISEHEDIPQNIPLPSESPEIIQAQTQSNEQNIQENPQQIEENPQQIEDEPEMHSVHDQDESWESESSHHEQDSDESEFESDSETLQNSETIQNSQDPQENIQKSENDTEKIEEKKIFSCKHYKRNGHKQCPECLKFVPCRICHDDSEYYNAKDLKKAHTLDRFKVTHIKCLHCETEQTIKKDCEKCGVNFAGYYCDICKFLDDDYVKKGIYHCTDCGICRVGGKENTFHCKPCGHCMPLVRKVDHEKCVGEGNGLNYDCSVCQEDLFSSRDPASQLKCGHHMHSKCFRKYSREYIFCPLCKKSLFDIEQMEMMFDPQVQSLVMPEDYKDKKMTILCNDCQKYNEVNFHFYSKCPDCRSYNTTKQ